ncbi:MAG: hypothetical protein VYC11_04925 [Candidatus Thermoplasmatota archaeon]|nr:hypothetical protein [Candidatus Thermoplasmatota archaeon]MED5486531.1 hypothetical protein [Candidatus Thermoplasmatota archaeon]
MTEEITTPPVVVYHKSPFTASLPYLATLIFATMMVSAYIETTTSWFELCSLIGFIIILWLAFSGVLLTNEKLGTKISVNLTQSEISVHSRGLRTEFKQNLCIEYQNSDCIVNRVRTETVTNRDGESGTATHYEIHLFRINRTHELIFSINGFLPSKFKASRLAKKIARITNLEHYNKPSEIPQPSPEANEEEPIKFGTILS